MGDWLFFSRNTITFKRNFRDKAHSSKCEKTILEIQTRDIHTPPPHPQEGFYADSAKIVPMSLTVWTFATCLQVQKNTSNHSSHNNIDKNNSGDWQLAFTLRQFDIKPASCQNIMIIINDLCCTCLQRIKGWKEQRKQWQFISLLN